MKSVYQISTQSKVVEGIDSLAAIEALLTQDTQYQVLAYLIPRIAFGTYHNGFHLQQDSLNFDDIDSIRIFSSDAELYLYRSHDPLTGVASATLRGRYRSDGAGASAFCKDAAQILTGSYVSGRKDQYLTIREDRGFELNVPASWIKHDLSKSRLLVFTRNYLEEWDNGQLSYNDHRFVSIKQHSEEE
ncbi:MAG: CRISPR-associated protein Csx19 [Candidatus Cloacimonadaceae bacterium]|jgi:CRISPR-associated protein (TIGR03984 family)|nr:CRISPR-associated protein Csx19 [Candidatus Cloacimonadota bacterium]MCK9241797.1 CRISPR-associated protein Csx19 [Candidatus Cloacimonadota bacterium]MDY0126886.1 CRISPR-associated protein Csx19 [Candidatus Cloacimonadaceae bacterium]